MYNIKLFKCKWTCPEGRTVEYVEEIELNDISMEYKNRRPTFASCRCECFLLVLVYTWPNSMGVSTKLTSKQKHSNTNAKLN